jgi:hypothetical protein
MRNINVDLLNLDLVWRNLKYYNKKYNLVKIKKNVNYIFSNEFIDFNCELYLDDSGELGITKINGISPKDCECFLTNEFMFKSERYALISYLLKNYNLCISPDLDLFHCLETKTVQLYSKDGNSCYAEKIFIDNENLYFIGTSSGLEKKLQSKFEEYWDLFLDTCKVVPLSNIKEIEHDKGSSQDYLTIYCKNGEIFKFNDNDFLDKDYLIEFKIDLKSKLN